MKFKIFLLSIVVLSLVGCSQKPIYKLSPANEDIDLSEGKEIAFRSDSLFETAINFEYFTETEICFYTYFYNGTDSIIEINPSEFRLSGEITNSDLKLKTKVVHAISSEVILQRIKKEKEDVKRDHHLLSCANCLLATLSFVFIDDEDEYADEKRGNTVINWIGNQAEIESATEAKLQKLKRKKIFWENEVLKKTFLHPDEEIGGLIYFPLIQFKICKISLPFKKDKIHFGFKKVQVN